MSLHVNLWFFALLLVAWPTLLKTYSLPIFLITELDLL